MYTLWKNEKFTVTEKKFRVSNVFTTENTKELICRKKNLSDSKFFIFPQCVPSIIVQFWSHLGTRKKLKVAIENIISM